MPPTPKPEILPIRASNDVVSVRQAARAMAASLGFSLIDQTKLVTAASELARNTLEHGGGGTASSRAHDHPPCRAADQRARDQGAAQPVGAQIRQSRVGPPVRPGAAPQRRRQARRPVGAGSESIAATRTCRVIARRQRQGIQSWGKSRAASLDCFASLAMTSLCDPGLAAPFRKLTRSGGAP